METDTITQQNQQQEWPDIDRHGPTGPGGPGEGGILVVPPLDSETTMDRPSMDGPGMSGGGSEIEIEM
ncbi:hypothetical protein [Acidithiobacillus sp.]